MHELPRPPRRVRSRMSAPPSYAIRNPQRITPKEVAVLANSNAERVLDILPLELCPALALLLRSIPPSCRFRNAVRAVAKDEV